MDHEEAVRWYGPWSSIKPDDAAAVIEHFAPKFHIWAVGDGALRPVVWPEGVPSWASGLWMRENATSPWLLDFQLTEDRDGEWVCARDPSIVLPLSEATWEGRGIRYLRPELVLLFKAKHNAAKDEADLVGHDTRRVTLSDRPNVRIGQN